MASLAFSHESFISSPQLAPVHYMCTETENKLYLIILFNRAVFRTKARCQRHQGLVNEPLEKNGRI